MNPPVGIVYSFSAARDKCALSITAASRNDRGVETIVYIETTEGKQFAIGVDAPYVTRLLTNENKDSSYRTVLLQIVIARDHRGSIHVIRRVSVTRIQPSGKLVILMSKPTAITLLLQPQGVSET